MERIAAERERRLEEYRDLSMGERRLWQEWKLGLPQAEQLEAAAMANASGYNSANLAGALSSCCGCVSELLIARMLHAGMVLVYGVFTPYTDGNGRLILASD